MSGMDVLTHTLYLIAAASFVLGLHLMNSPASARRGNQLSAAGMVVAVGTTVLVLAQGPALTGTAVIVLVAGLLLGGGVGLIAARRVRMTAMPQLVSVFNAVGGGAAALIAIYTAIDIAGPAASIDSSVTTGLSISLDLLIGGVTFSGSLIAGGKLAGQISGAPIVVPMGRGINLVLAVVAVASGISYIVGFGGVPILFLLSACALAIGLLSTLPIGGADMPVVISLLNAFTGTAVAMAGFVIDSTPLIIAGALVGAAGGILTKLMADAMNRSLISIIAGGFGTGDAVTAGPMDAGSGIVREITVDDAALQLAYAGRVVIVPGYGLAAAQAQHEIVKLAQTLVKHGIDVEFAIHPVAGRMPGHMNVLLAEANAPYEQMKDMEEANPQFSRTDVVLVVGANDVTNPAARRLGNAVSGMPILNVDEARSVIVIKRSMGHGYAGIDNELYTDPKTAMLFGDAKVALNALVAGLDAYVN